MEYLSKLYALESTLSIDEDITPFWKQEVVMGWKNNYDESDDSPWLPRQGLLEWLKPGALQRILATTPEIDQ